MFTNQFSASGYLKHFKVDKLLKLFHKEWVCPVKRKRLLITKISQKKDKIPIFIVKKVA